MDGMRRGQSCDVKLIRSVCDTYDINSDWLLNGIGAMKRGEAATTDSLPSVEDIAPYLQRLSRTETIKAIHFLSGQLLLSAEVGCCDDESVAPPIPWMDQGPMN